MTEQKMKDLGNEVIDAIVEHRTKMTDKKVYATNSYEALNEIVKREMPLNTED